VLRRGKPSSVKLLPKAMLVDVLALDHHVRAADGVGLGVVVLAEDLQAGVGVELAQVLLGDREHAARAAGRVVERLDDALGGQHVAVLAEQQVDHQPDDLARREVVAGLSLDASLNRRISSSKM
jgi:uncharacterized membrane protein YcjF (UPF0283 family)